MKNSWRFEHKLTNKTFSPMKEFCSKCQTFLHSTVYYHLDFFNSNLFQCLFQMANLKTNCKLVLQQASFVHKIIHRVSVIFLLIFPFPNFTDKLLSTQVMSWKTFFFLQLFLNNHLESKQTYCIVNLDYTTIS